MRPASPTYASTARSTYYEAHIGIGRRRGNGSGKGKDANIHAYKCIVISRKHISGLLHNPVIARMTDTEEREEIFLSSSLSLSLCLSRNRMEIALQMQERECINSRNIADGIEIVSVIS